MRTNKGRTIEIQAQENQYLSELSFQILRGEGRVDSFP